MKSEESLKRFYVGDFYKDTDGEICMREDHPQMKDPGSTVNEYLSNHGEWERTRIVVSGLPLYPSHY